MEILKLVITVLFVIAALAIIVVVLLQEGKSAGLGSLNGSGNSDSYWEKNKKNTLEGKFETWTKLTAGLFVVFALVLMLINSNGKVAQTQVPAENAVTATEQNAETQTEGEATTPESETATTEGATPEATTADDQAANEAEADNADATTDNAQDSANSAN